MFGSSHHQQPAAADKQGSSGGNSCNQGCCLHNNIPGERVPELRVYGHVCLSLFRQASRFHTVQLHIDECKPLFMQAQGSIVELFSLIPSGIRASRLANRKYSSLSSFDSFILSILASVFTNLINRMQGCTAACYHFRDLTKMVI